MKILRTILLLALALLAAWPVRAQNQPTPSPDDLAWEVYRIFHRHCADCHGGHRAKPKGGFGHVLDLERMSSDPDLVVPGQPDESEIYLLMIDPDPDFLMPPPDSDTPPVSEADIAIVREWIQAGAGVPLNAGEDPAVAEPASDAMRAGAAPGFLEITGRLHPLVVHFPIALILAALGARVLGLKEAARWCLWIGALGSLAAVTSGWLSASAQGYRPATVFSHRWLGVATSIAALLAAVTFEAARRRIAGASQRVAERAPRSDAASVFALALLFLAAILVGITGHMGGKLVHGDWMKGIGSGDAASFGPDGAESLPQRSTKGEAG